MIDISITAYRGFSAVAGETNLSTLLSNIRGGTYFPAVHKVEEQLRLGDLAKANAIKKQLPFFTLTGNYHTVRQSHSLIRYNPVITIDVDDLEDGRIEGVRQALASDPDVLAFFLTPKRHGFKIFLYLRTEYARRLRQTAFSVPVITYSELEKHHSLMYEAARLHIEQVTGVEVDVSGKDIGRGFFASFDVQAYFNTELLGEIEEIGTKVVSEKKVSEKPFNPTLPLETSPWHALEYKKALSTTRRSEKFREGNRDNFLFVLGNRCFRKDIPEEVAIAFAVRDFQQDDLDVASAIRNAYRYVSKTQAAVKAKEEKVPVVSRIMDFLSCRYRFRRNVILDRLEFAEITQGGDTEVAAETSSPVFRPLRAKDLNSIYVNLLTDGVNCSLNTLKAIVDSDYASCFNPFEDYLLNLPAWDGTRDYIGELADTVLTEDREFWRESFRRWLVGSVACALREKKVNQLVLILFGGPGQGQKHLDKPPVASLVERILPYGHD